MYDVWNSTGKPMSGQVHDIKCSSHLRYKLAIRDCYVKFETQLYDELYDRFFKNKRPTEFWKSWNSKFRKNLSNDISVDDCKDSCCIANKFADHFRAVYCDTVSDKSSVVNINTDVQATPASTITSNNVDVTQLMTVEMMQQELSYRKQIARQLHKH